MSICISKRDFCGNYIFGVSNSEIYSSMEIGMKGKVPVMTFTRIVELIF
jgi:hypothetical protein